MSHLGPELMHVLAADRLAEAEYTGRPREQSGRGASPRWLARLRNRRDSPTRAHPR